MTGCRDRAKHSDAQLHHLHPTSFHVDRSHRWWLAAFVLLGLLPWSSTARRTRRYDMPSRECSVSEIRKVTSAAILSSTHHIEPASNPCVLKFSADEVPNSSKRIQIITEKINITDCNTSLSLFYDTVTSNHPDYKFDCRSGIAKTLVTRGSHLTLLLQEPTDRGFDFLLVITAFKTAGRCDDIICKKDEDLKCIHEDLKCDGFKNCEDGSDEEDCPASNMQGGSGRKRMLKSQLFRWGMKGFIGMVFGAVTFVVLTIIAGVACCHLKGMTGSTVRGGYIPASGGSNHNNTNSTITETILARIPCLKFLAQRNCNGPTAQLGGEEGIKAIHSYYPPVPGEASQGPPPAIPLGYANPQTESGYSPQHSQTKGEPGTVGYQAGVEKVNMTPH